VIVERAVNVLIDQTMKRRFAQTRAPRKPRSEKPSKANSQSSNSHNAHNSNSQNSRSATDSLNSNSHNSRNSSSRSPRKAHSRYIPRAVVRAVHQRDAGQCTFVSSDGKRCSERGFLELHHHDPFARGGEATVENLRLVCRAHNALFAERDYGRTFMRT